MPGILVYSDGDNVTLTWTPTDVLPAEIEFSSCYSVYLNVELYLHDFREGWYFYNNLGIVENVGFLFIDSLPQGPYHDLLVPAAIPLSVVDSETLATIHPSSSTDWANWHMESSVLQRICTIIRYQSSRLLSILG